MAMGTAERGENSLNRKVIVKDGCPKIRQKLILSV